MNFRANPFLSSFTNRLMFIIFMALLKISFADVYQIKEIAFAKISPSDAAYIVFVLEPGHKVTSLEIKGNWILVINPKNKKTNGWVRSTFLQKVILKTQVTNRSNPDSARQKIIKPEIAKNNVIIQKKNSLNPSILIATSVAVVLFFMIVYAIVSAGRKDRELNQPGTNNHGQQSTEPTQVNSENTIRTTEASYNENTTSTNYKPNSRKKEFKSIKFNEKNAGNTFIDLDLADLVDALTGAPLQPTKTLYQCFNCKVYYQSHSYEVITSENDGQCVSCLQKNIVCVTGHHEQRGRNADVRLITLDNYQKYVGRVITFAGLVHDVLTSRRGTDYAVMFENKSWIKGFKMIVFRGDVGRIGGYSYLYSLIGHTIHIRGLLVHHNRYGYEIIISDQSMILSVQ